MREKIKQYVLNLLIARDQLWNARLGGSPDESISSRLWRNREKWWGRVGVAFVDWLFSLLGQKEHCKNSLEPADRSEKEVLK